MSESQTTELIAVKTLNPVEVFAPGGVDKIIADLEANVRAIKTDISTAKGRAEVKSLAYKVTRSKTALDDLGKTLVADMKATVAKVDADRRVVRDRLDALAEEVRKPLTDWEDADKRRIGKHEADLDILEGLAVFLTPEPAAAHIQERLDMLAAYPPRDWQEFTQRATETMATLKRSLEASLDLAVRREAERAELERLRKESEERARKEREEQIAREAAERAKREAEAEARAAAERVEVERRREAEAAAARQREAEEAAAKAEADRKAAEEAARRAELARQEAEARADRERVAAAEQTERDKQEAVARAQEEERRRVAAEEARQKAEAEAREKDRAHRAKIHGEALAALTAAGVPEDAAKAAIVAIAKGGVPHVTIRY